MYYEFAEKKTIRHLEGGFHVIIIAFRLAQFSKNSVFTEVVVETLRFFWCCMNFITHGHKSDTYYRSVRHSCPTLIKDLDTDNYRLPWRRLRVIPIKTHTQNVQRMSVLIHH